MLEEKITAGYQAEEDYIQRERQMQCRLVKEQREEDARREMRLGYLQNHVRGQEMDFQRLHRIMGVKFTPEKPDSVQDIVKASLSHEQRNASLLHYVGVQNAQVEEIEEQVCKCRPAHPDNFLRHRHTPRARAQPSHSCMQLRSLEAEEAELLIDKRQMEEKGVTTASEAERLASSSRIISEGIEKRDEDLKKLCPHMENLCTMSGAMEKVKHDDGGILALKGCRPDTLTDCARSGARHSRISCPPAPAPAERACVLGGRAQIYG